MAKWICAVELLVVGLWSIVRQGFASGIQRALRQTNSQNGAEECDTLRVAGFHESATTTTTTVAASLSSKEGMRRLGPCSVVVCFTPLLDVTP